MVARSLTEAERSEGLREYPLGRTPLVFVASKEHVAEGITTADLIDVFTGARQSWPNGARLRLMIRPPQDSDTLVLKAASARLREALLAAEARTGLYMPITDDEAFQYLERVPGAFGITSLAMLTTSGSTTLEPLRLDGHAPTLDALQSGSYKLSQPVVLVLGPNSPPGARDFVAFATSESAKPLLRRSGVFPELR